MKRLVLFLAALLLLSAGPARAAGKILNISYVKSPFNLQMIVMKERGLLEKRLNPLGLTVNWPEIDSGAKQALALASGDLDVAGVINTTSVLMANGEGNPVRIIAGVARPVDVFALVARKDGATSIKELKGKTVAGPKGTVLHQLLAAALAKEGLSMDDVAFIQMDIPAACAALHSGRADAALLAANMVIKARQEGARVLTTADGLVVPKLVMATSEALSKSRPEELAAVIKAHDEAWNWIAANHDEAIALGAKIQGITIEEAEQLFRWSHFTQRCAPEDIASMRDDMRFMLDTGMMRNETDVESLFLPQAFE